MWNWSIFSHWHDVGAGLRYSPAIRRMVDPPDGSYGNLFNPLVYSEDQGGSAELANDSQFSEDPPLRKETMMAYNPDIHHRRSIRLKNYDYTTPGAYFITTCT